MKRWLPLLLWLGLAAPAWAQQNTNTVPPSCTVAQLAGGTCVPGKLGTRVRVSNGDLPSGDLDCATGTGTNNVLCEYDGTSWVSKDMGASATLALVDRDHDGDIDGADLQATINTCGLGFTPSTDGACRITIDERTVLFNSTVTIGDSTLANPNGIQYGIIIEGIGTCHGGAGGTYTSGTVFKWNSSGGALNGPMIQVNSGYWVQIQDLCMSMDTDMTNGGNSARYGIEYLADPPNGQVQSPRLFNVHIFGPTIGGVPSGMTGIYMTSATGSPPSGQVDKAVFEGLWLDNLDIGLEVNGLQILTNHIHDSQITGVTTGVKVAGGNIDIADSVVQCSSANCVAIWLRYVSGGSAAKTVLSNIYGEFSAANTTILKVGEGATDNTPPSGAIDATNFGPTAPITLENSYFRNNGGAGVNAWILDASLQSDVTIRETQFNSPLQTNLWFIWAGARGGGNAWGPVIHWENNRNNEFFVYGTDASPTFVFNLAGNVNVDFGDQDAIKYLGGTVNSGGHVNQADLMLGRSDHQRCITTNGHGATTLDGTGLTPLTAGTATAAAWAVTTLTTRSPKVDYVTAAAANTPALVTAQNGAGTRALTATVATQLDAGGFTWFARFGLAGTLTTARLAAGLFGTGAFTDTVDPSANGNSADSVYFGCDAVDANISICANNETLTSACTNLGASYPCHTPGASYEAWLWQVPSTAGAAGQIYYRLHRLDSENNVSGIIPTGNGTPRNTVALGPAVWLNSGTGANSVTLRFMEMCLWDTL